MRLGGEARKRCGLTVALRPWAWGLRCRRRHRGGVAGPRPLEHEAQPHQGDQHQLVKQEMGNHGTTPSDSSTNDGIVPAFQTAGISRSLEVHDLERIKYFIYPLRGLVSSIIRYNMLISFNSVSLRKSHTL